MNNTCCLQLSHRSSQPFLYCFSRTHFMYVFFEFFEFLCVSCSSIHFCAFYNLCSCIGLNLYSLSPSLSLFLSLLVTVHPARQSLVHSGVFYFIRHFLFLSLSPSYFCVCVHVTKSVSVSFSVKFFMQMQFCR